MSFTLKLKEKEKVNKFTVLFKYLKNVCPDVMANINEDGFHIQGLCSAHVLLFELDLSKEWFDEYDTTFVTQVNLGLNCEILSNIISCVSDGQLLSFEYSERNLDKLTISMENNNNNTNTLEKSFEVSLMDMDVDPLEVPYMETDIEINILSSNFEGIINQLIKFGSDVKFNCDNDGMVLESMGDCNTMKVKIKEDDIETYAIVEDLEYNSTYALKYLKYVSDFSKLNGSLDIHFIVDNPALFIYDLNIKDWKDDDEIEEDDEGDDENKSVKKNTIKFYLAPKMD